MSSLQAASCFFAVTNTCFSSEGRASFPVGAPNRVCFSKVSQGSALKVPLRTGATLSVQPHLSSEETCAVSTIKELLAGGDDDFSFSAYDMGWIARIPQPDAGLEPQFPRILEWIVENQEEDGSWDGGADDLQRVCSTMSCVIALKTWNGGQCSIQRGLRFLNSHLPLISDKLVNGMELVASKLIEDAQRLGLELDYTSSYVQGIRDRFLLGVPKDAVEQYPTSFVHIFEAFEDRPKWQHLLRFQSSSGFLFSVTLTACAYLHTGDQKCLRCLKKLVCRSVPESRENQRLLQKLRIITLLENLGVERFFQQEIQQTMIQAYGYWRQNVGQRRHLRRFEDGALLFCLLRRHGYDVCPDVLHESQEDLSSVSQFLFPSERKRIPRTIASDEESRSLPWYSIMHRILHIEYMTKSTNEYKLREHDAILAFAKSDFSSCQSIYQKDLQQVMRWNEHCKFARLGCARQKDVFCFFTAAATMFEPELSTARIVWAKMSVLTTVIDDFMDTHSSLDNLRNFHTAVTRWDTAGLELNEDAKLLLRGLFDTVRWTAESALPLQGRDVTESLRAQWKRLCAAFLREAEWRLSNHCPTMEEYMSNGVTSFALGPIMLSAIFFLGEKLEDSVLDHPDCINMFRRTSTIGRLLNDIQGFDRESRGGEFSWITIYTKEHPGAGADDAVARMREIIKRRREELVEDILRPRAVPRKCKRVFESMMRILHFVYRRDDGFSSSDDLKEHVNKVLYARLDQ